MDNKKAIRNLIIYLGIPIAVIIVLATVFSGRTKTTQKYSEIINEFENQNVVEYSMDLGNGEMIIKLKDGRSISYVAPSVALLYDDIKPYVEEYNKENPNNKMVVDLKRAAENRKKYDATGDEAVEYLIELLIHEDTYEADHSVFGGCTHPSACLSEGNKTD